MKLDKDSFEEIIMTITHNRTRSLLTAFGVFWGIFMLVALLGGGKGLQNIMNANFEGFATNSGFVWVQQTQLPFRGFQKGRTWNMNVHDIDLLKDKVKELDVVTPSIVRFNIPAVFKSKKSTCILKGLRPDYQSIEVQNMEHGRFINDIDIRESRKVCVIGHRIYEELFNPGTDPCGTYLQVGGIYYKIIGLADNTTGGVNIQGQSSESVIIPFPTMQLAYNMKSDFEMLSFTVKPGVKVSNIQPLIERIIKQAHFISPLDKQAVMLFNTEALFSMMDDLFKGIRVLVWMVGLGTLLAGAIGVSNIMMVTVKERTSEIGIRRAIGARPKDIMQQILWESIILTSVAGMLGITMGVLSLQGMEQLNIEGKTYAFQISFSLAVGTTLLLIVLGLLAGLAPAYRAMAIKPIDAIRDE